MTPTLLKRIDGLEIWTLAGKTSQHFAVRLSARRAQIVDSLAQAERLFSAALARARIARAH